MSITRRNFLHLAGMGGGALVLGNKIVFSNSLPEETDSYRHPVYGWINQQNGPKPEFAWRNVEDIIYHESRFKNKNWQHAPEFCALMEQNWVFNRAMRWIRNEDDTILCYSGEGDLQLTGDRRVSEWFTDPANEVVNNTGVYTQFLKRNTVRVRDAVVMPCFQFHLGQHPVAEFEITEADCEWQVCLGIKGRSGVPLFSSGWRKGTGKISCNIAELYTLKGYTKNYAEMHFVVAVWSHTPEKTAKIIFQSRLKAHSAIVACLPVIRQANQFHHGLLPFSAVCVDENGYLIKASQTTLRLGFPGGKIITMNENKGIWSAEIPDLKVGNHQISVESNNKNIRKTHQVIRVTDGHFTKYSKDNRTIVKGNKVLNPMSGSYQGAFYFQGNGSENENLINGQAEWDAWDKNDEHLHWWESLTEKELSDRFSYLQQCGWDVLHLNQFWGNWERLDAGGNIAPHAAEQLALYIRIADQYGLMHIQDVSHYPYVPKLTTFHGTVVWKQYMESGFKDEDWFNPENEPFRTIFHRYINDFAILFKDETSLFALGASGEGDKSNKLPRTNDIIETLRNVDKNHLFMGEPIHTFYDGLPPDSTKGWTQDLLGSRSYWCGKEIESESDIAIYFKVNRMQDNIVLMEGAFPAPNCYSKMVFLPDQDEYQSWVGTEYYRRHVRDNLYLGLVARQALMVTWDEQMTEDERIVLSRVKKMVDWTMDEEPADLSILVDSSIFRDNRKTIAVYEQYFSQKLPLRYKFVRKDSFKDESYPHIDATLPTSDHLQNIFAAGLPDIVQGNLLFEVSEGYAINYTVWKDKDSILLYVYNVSNHFIHEVMFSYNHRLPDPCDLLLKCKMDMTAYRIYAWDLNLKEEMTPATGGSLLLNIQNTSHDYLILLKRAP